MPTAEELVEKHLAAGAEHYASGRIVEALSEWRQALAADPLDADAHYDVGLALYETGMTEEGIGHWREAIRLSPDFFEPYYQLVCALWDRQEVNKGVWRDARLLCWRALALDAATVVQKAYLLRFLGVAEWNQGERHRAIATMKASVSVQPDQWAYEHLSEMQARTGQWQASLKTFHEMAELPDCDFSRYERCHGRVRVVGVVVLLIGAALLVGRMARRR